MQIRVNKTFHFEAAHQLPFHNGKCANEHGHSYKVELCIRGPIQDTHPDNPESGMVIDFARIKEEWEVIDKTYGFDHTNLNKLMPNPTAENICAWLAGYFDKLQPFDDYSGVAVVRIRVHETDDSYVEWNIDDQYIATTA
jgi:6-pyruvoyltetrahydropterin/6-carboxytetrahydropterin synthase